MPNEDLPGHFALDSPPASASDSSPSQPNTNANGNGNNLAHHEGHLPQTPPNPKRPRPTHQQHSRSPSLPSPLAMSLHHLGIGTPSPLLRQLSTFSSPPTWGSPPLLGIGITGKDDHHEGLLSVEASSPSSGLEEEVDADHELTQDGKDVLVQRLGDLIQHLRGAVRVQNLGELHGKVDEMKAVLGSGRGASLAGMGGGDDMLSAKRLSSPSGRPQGDLSFQARPLEEPELVVSAIPPAGETNPPDVTAEVALEAEKLNAELVKLAERLRKRKEESDHIQAMLVERAETAAAHILELQGYVAELEDEIGGNESDLRHLRIELRAIQTLCHEFVPPDADPDLVQSIENWKSDWARLRERMSSNKKSRRHRQGGDGEGDSTILTPSVSSMSMLESPFR
ncbi:hypothetical protein B0T16DRAFT_242515 [Cercophora newfieldiana]|uniref:Uncharacterized protein n=1 Tax=Cercophora newfieldiana TaxID=92897 RepID=A0AA39XT64_9PEZI|nr:hypothetical protein B0T16DRAFT_242515 [Cercophora newfieldiana]